MYVASGVMQGLDCASLYNHKVTYRKQNSFGHKLMSKATMHSHVPTHVY